MDSGPGQALRLSRPSGIVGEVCPPITGNFFRCVAILRKAGLGQAHKTATGEWVSDGDNALKDFECNRDVTPTIDTQTVVDCCSTR